MIRLSVGKFGFYAVTEDREEMKSLMQAGFNIDGATGVFKTKAMSALTPFKNLFDETLKKYLSKFFIIVDETPLHLVGFDRLKEFQRPAAHWVLSRNRSCLAIAPGGGKTPITYTVLNSAPGKTLVICPAYLVYMWGETAWTEWSSGQIPYIIDFDMSRFDPAKFDEAEIIFIPDSRLDDYKTILLGTKWKWLVVDEAHRFKTRASQRGTVMWGRTQKDVAKSLAWKSERVLTLSGTILPNRPLELFPMLQVLAPEVIDFMDKDGFGTRYCGGYFDNEKYQYNYNGESNTDVLSDRLTRDYMYVISRETLKKHLPPLTEEVLLIGGKVQVQILALQNKIRKEFNADYEKIIEESETHPHIATLRKMIGLQTAAFAIPIIAEMLAENPKTKVVLFAHHKEVIEKIAFGLFEYGVIVIDGESPRNIRQNLADQFQWEPEKRVLLGNMNAMGEGLTITQNVQYVGIIEPAWSPSQNWQAIDRVHRITQTEQCLAQYFVLRGTMTVNIMNANLKKTKVINSVIKERENGN